jgi:putative transcriptional regulator
MINYHPSEAVLEEFVSGNLHASIAMIVSSHVEMCSKCQERVMDLTEKAASNVFDMEDDFFKLDMEANSKLFDENHTPHTDMISSITDLDMEPVNESAVAVTEIEVSGQTIALPNAIRSIALKEWQGIGKISRARLTLDDDQRRMSLLHIDKGGSVPMHSHKGFEITLLLDGSFEDDMGVYSKGDFIWLDHKHTHNPTTLEGCVCLTVSSDALKFTQGVSQLINPLGKLIY